MKLPQLENSSCLRTGSILTCVPAAQKSRANATRPSSCWDVFGRIDNSGSAHSLAAAIWTISSSCGNTLQARVVLLLRTGADWSRSPCPAALAAVQGQPAGQRCSSWGSVCAQTSEALANLKMTAENKNCKLCNGLLNSLNFPLP